MIFHSIDYDTASGVLLMPTEMITINEADNELRYLPLGDGGFIASKKSVEAMAHQAFNAFKFMPCPNKS